MLICCRWHFGQKISFEKFQKPSVIALSRQCYIQLHSFNLISIYFNKFSNQNVMFKTIHKISATELIAGDRVYFWECLVDILPLKKNNAFTVTGLPCICCFSKLLGISSGYFSHSRIFAHLIISTYCVEYYL